jgi:hypothetical protein
MRVNIGDVLVCDSRDALGAVGERGYAGANDEHLAQISDRRGHHHDLGRVARRHLRGTGVIAATRLRARVGTDDNLSAGRLFYSGARA